MQPTLATLFVTCLVVGCQSSPRPADAVQELVAPEPVGPCRNEAGPLPFQPPSFASDGTISLGMLLPTPIMDAAVHDIVRTRLLSGSTATQITEVGKLDTAPPPACMYTVVTPSQACLIAPTGRFWASRQVTLFPVSGSRVGTWTLVYEFRNDTCLPTVDREWIALAMGAHPTMRMVRFGVDVDYTGSISPGDTANDGSDLRPTIAMWPADEQAQYRRRQHFAAYPSTTADGKTITRDLTWYVSGDAAGQRWTTRLRARDGRVLLERDHVRTSWILREGDQLFWEGGPL